jgi:hypothetical protein
VLVCSEFGGAPFTAVRTAGLSGETPNSPTSPRAKPSGLSASGSNPLLKAALNANLNRVNHTTAMPQQSSSLGPQTAASGPGSLAQHHQQQQQQQQLQQQQHHHSLSSNVKQRLKEYFVARNPEVVAAPAAHDGGSSNAAAGQLAQIQLQHGQGTDADEDTEQLLLEQR